MSENQTSTPYNLAPDEKSAPVMAYTETSVVWGDVIVKNTIRVSTWLRSTVIPDHIHLLNACCLLIASGSPDKAAFFNELHLPTAQIIAFHLIPPAKDPPDFDPSEPNRRLEPVALLAGPFRLNGHLRLAGKTDLAKYIDISHELFTSIYNVEISTPGLPAVGVIRVPFMLTRMAVTIFASRKDAA